MGLLKPKTPPKRRIDILHDNAEWLRVAVQNHHAELDDHAVAVHCEIDALTQTIADKHAEVNSLDGLRVP